MVKRKSADGGEQLGWVTPYEEILIWLYREREAQERLEILDGLMEDSDTMKDLLSPDCGAIYPKSGDRWRH